MVRYRDCVEMNMTCRAGRTDAKSWHPGGVMMQAKVLPTGKPSVPCLPPSPRPSPLPKAQAQIFQSGIQHLPCRFHWIYYKRCLHLNVWPQLTTPLSPPPSLSDFPGCSGLRLPGAPETRPGSPPPWFYSCCSPSWNALPDSVWESCSPLILPKALLKRRVLPGAACPQTL